MADYCLVYGMIHFTSPAGWLPVHRDQLRAQRSVTSMGKLYLFTSANTCTKFNTKGVSFWQLRVKQWIYKSCRNLPHTIPWQSAGICDHCTCSHRHQWSSQCDHTLTHDSEGPLHDEPSVHLAKPIANIHEFANLHKFTQKTNRALHTATAHFLLLFTREKSGLKTPYQYTETEWGI